MKDELLMPALAPQDHLTRSWLRLVCIAALLGALGMPVHAQDICMFWTNRHDQVPGQGVGSPGQRAHHAMAYDNDRGVTVLFGGEIGVTESETYFNDTWEYDGTNQWRKIYITGPSPSPRSFHAMAYDRVRHYVLLYGGQAGSGSLSDTWAYTGNGFYGTWTNLPAHAPFVELSLPALAGHAMAFDTVGNMVVMLGGWDGIYTGNSQKQCAYSSGLNHFSYTPSTLGYLWDGSNWYGYCSDLSPYVTVYQLYLNQAVYGLSFAFDESLGWGIALGGYTQAYEQGLVGSHYNHFVPDTNCYPECISVSNGAGWWDDGPGPPARAEAVMAYDAVRQRVVLVGGVGNTDVGAETCEYSLLTGWLTLPSLPPLPVNDAPSGRAGSAMVYDSRRQVFVLMGGAGAGAQVQVPGDVTRGAGSRFSDTWELVPARVLIVQDPTNLVASVCSAAQFYVAAAGNGTLHYQWRQDGSPLAESAPFQGTASSVLTIQPATYAQQGNYDVVIFDDCAVSSTVTSRVATLTLQPGLQWILRATNGPTARTAAAMAYDSRRHVTVMFGGLGGIPGNTNQLLPLNDLWEWDGSVWNQRMSAAPTNGWTRDTNGYPHPSYQGGQPTARFGHSMAYDSRYGWVVLFGGHGPDLDGFDTPFNDTWTWDGLNWTFRGTNSAPAARFRAVMAYDSDHGATVVYGGLIYSAGQGGVVWQWDPGGWTSNSPPDGPVSNTYQDTAAAAYDSFRHTMLVGPVTDGYNDFYFWDWNGLSWNPDGPGFSIPWDESPANGAMVFDSYRRRDVYFGGQIYGTPQPTNTTAFWDGSNWTILSNSVAMPSPRFYHAMAYDSARNATVMVGGENGYTNGTDQLVGNETWELMALDTPVMNTQPLSQFHNPGETAVFSVAALGPPGASLSYTWHHGTAGLLDGGRVSGTASATLTVSNVTADDAGPYVVDVACSCGTITSQPAFLALAAALQIYYAPGSSSSGTLIWFAPNAVLQTADNVKGPWTQVPGAISPFTISLAGQAKFFRLH